jgi:hypothetical protein
MNFDAKVEIASTYAHSTVRQTIEGAALTDVSLSLFTRAERCCAECMQPFKDADTVVVISPSKILPHINTDGNAELSIPLNEVFAVHTMNEDGATCLEDFIARFVQNKIKGNIPIPGENAESNPVTPGIEISNNQNE